LSNKGSNGKRWAIIIIQNIQHSNVPIRNIQKTKPPYTVDYREDRVHGSTGIVFSLFITMKSKICISEMTTSRRHNLSTQPTRREEKRVWVIK
jgi:hypothetical protein